MINENDKQIAAASLLALVSAASSHNSEQKSTPKERVQSNQIAKNSTSCDSGDGIDISEEKTHNLLNEDPTKEHRYVSESSSVEEEGDEHNLVTSSSFVQTSSTSNMNPQNVPYALMKLLTNKEHIDTLCFLPDNYKFAVINSKKFSKEIMPKYFQLTKFGCFVNKLERWGFTHHADINNEKHVFFHPLFRNGDWGSISLIRYTPARARSGDRSSNKRRVEPVSSIESRDLKVPRMELSLSHGFLSPLEQDYQKFQMLHQLDTRLAMFQNTINSRNRPLSYGSYQQIDDVMKTSDAVKPMTSIDSLTQEQVNSATKSIVAGAIDCLLRDEHHTIQRTKRK